MPSITEATVATEHASRYLQQLCKHWGHKFTVDFTPGAGTIEMPHGRTVMRADAAALHVAVEAEDAAGAEQLARVVADHILRFAFREELRFDWSPVSDR